MPSAVPVAEVVSVVACGGSGDRIEIDAAASDGAVTAGDASRSTIGDRAAVEILWSALGARLVSVREPILDGSTTSDDRVDRLTFDRDATRSGRSIEQDRRRLPPETTGAWGRCNAAIDVIDHEIRT